MAFGAGLAVGLFMGIGLGRTVLAKLKKGTTRHVVLFGFKPSVSEDRKRAIAAQFEGLAETIPQVRSFEWGTDVSIENKAEGFTHAFLLTFHSQKDRTAYVDSEAHQAFLHSGINYLDKLIIIDYLPKTVKTDPRPFL